MASIGSQRPHKPQKFSYNKFQASRIPTTGTDGRLWLSQALYLMPKDAYSAYLGSLEAHACPLGGSKVHCLRDVVATTYFGHKGSREADNKLPTLLYSPVNLDPLLAQHLWGDLGR